MSKLSHENNLDFLAAGARALLGRAADSCGASLPETVKGSNEWLLSVLKQEGLSERLSQRGVNASDLARLVQARLSQGSTGRPLPLTELAANAAERANHRGRQFAHELDLIAVLMRASDTSSTRADRGTPTRNSGRKARQTSARVRRQPTPTLDRFGRDLNEEAEKGKLSPCVGRSREIDLVIQTLARRTKRNPLLLGQAGVGKTAIVEGLARRIVSGRVPDFLLRARIVELQPTVLFAGSSCSSEFEERVNAVIQEASQPGIILFIDEVHSAVGKGDHAGAGDLAGLLKPALARGEVACIAATTDGEWRQFIEPDPALERRFHPVRVQELSRVDTLLALRTVRRSLEKLRGVSVPDEVLVWLVSFAHRAIHNRAFPDKAIDLLEQVVARAVVHGEGAVTLETAREVAMRAVGMPLGLEGRLDAVRSELAGLLTEGEIEKVIARLELTLRGLNLARERPNMVALLSGQAASCCGSLAAALAKALFDSADRVLRIDLSTMMDEHLTNLLGAPPGYVGFGRPTPLDPVTRTPWMVICLENVHACHPNVRQAIVQGLTSGVITESDGRRVYLSESLVLLTAPFADAARPLGFREAASRGPDMRAEAVRSLGQALAEQTDMFLAGQDVSRPVGDWPGLSLLAALARRWREAGVELEWDPAAVEWLRSQGRECEKRLETRLSGLARTMLSAPGGRVRLIYRDDTLQVAVPELSPSAAPAPPAGKPGAVSLFRIGADGQEIQG